jgi:2-amino-4-hydroxy-6-hydroxymethyldihydropteridine diphosphokinase/dihydropteroate synthase
MVILGLGSNVGDRLLNLREASQKIAKIVGVTIQRISPLYVSEALLPDHAPAEWNKPFLNLALSCETQLAPSEFLKQLKNIETVMGRQSHLLHWGPRIIDIDILAWDNLILQSENLTVPHIHLLNRPFALWPLADIAPLWSFPGSGQYQHKTAAEIVEKWGNRFLGDAPFHTRQIYQRLEAPQLMGILNVTPDSFSDGGNFLPPERAVSHARALVEAGAEIIDLGAEATAPGATPLDAKTEWERIQPVLTELAAVREQWLIPPRLSIDTYHPETAKKALEAGAHWINDVSGLDDIPMREVLAETQSECVVMHHLSVPANKKIVLARHEDPVAYVYEWAEKRLTELQQHGIKKEKMIFDPGIGFGKTPEQSLLLLQHIAVFKQLGVRLLVGHSRKGFLSLFTHQPAALRDIETLSAAIYLATQAVDYLRIHEVGFCARALCVKAALTV